MAVRQFKGVFVPMRRYLRALDISQMISPTTATTSNIPDHTPALKIPPIISQPVSAIAIKANMP